MRVSLVSIHAARAGGDSLPLNLLKGKRLPILFRAPHPPRRRSSARTGPKSHKLSGSKLIPTARTSRRFFARFRSARHKINGPCGS